MVHQFGEITGENIIPEKKVTSQSKEAVTILGTISRCKAIPVPKKYKSIV